VFEIHFSGGTQVTPIRIITYKGLTVE